MFGSLKRPSRDFHCLNSTQRSLIPSTQTNKFLGLHCFPKVFIQKRKYPTSLSTILLQKSKKSAPVIRELRCFGLAEVWTELLKGRDKPGHEKSKGICRALSVWREFEFRFAGNPREICKLKISVQYFNFLTMLSSMMFQRCEFPTSVTEQ